MDILVSNESAARDNVLRFEKELARDPKLPDIMAYAHGWYAVRSDTGWAFGPSKFVGYVGNHAKAYLSTHRERDGRLTERALSQWFAEVPANAALYRELEASLREIFARHGRSPNKRLRISVLKTELETVVVSRPADVSRITVDPEICGGRPCIRGMRIRVSDLLDLLASGYDKSEILADYPYLEDGDIEASLQYASQAVDHRVIRAA